jgi:ferredoxin-nitrate reductase
MVCFCIGVRRGRLRQAIAAGATDLDALIKATRCCLGCGTCRIDVLDLLDAELNARKAAKPAT